MAPEPAQSATRRRSTRRLSFDSTATDAGQRMSRRSSESNVASIRSFIDREVSMRDLLGTSDSTKSHRSSYKSLTSRGSEMEEIAKKRRTSKEAKPSNLDSFDGAFDWFIKNFIEDPVARTFCSVEKSNGPDDEDSDRATNAQDGSGVAYVRFGFPRIDHSGYVIEDDAKWADARLGKLGLHRAINKHLSVEKMCFIQKKSNLPAGASKERISKHIKDLLNTQHINMLNCQDVFEDEVSLYLMFEDFPCVTLSSVLTDYAWTQEQISNLARECCAAVAHAHDNNLCHIGLSLSHVFLPKDCLHDPKITKIFGFGFMGILTADTADRSLWAPDVLDMYNRLGHAFTTKMEPSQRTGADIWCLGSIVYTLIAGRPPVLDGFRWTFSTAFDVMDGECKGLVEGLLRKDPVERMKPKQALISPWIRKYWKPHHARKVFHKLDRFCHASLATRLFGRFVVRFLNAEQMRKIALSFYELDSQGDGLLDQGDLLLACKAYADIPQASYRRMRDTLCDGESKPVDLQRFAECMAEEVIDGPALRHAFESLDNDSSECITAAELYESLRDLDKALTLHDVVLHIEATEQQFGDKKEEMGAGDGTIDFDEFVRLFPTRVARLKAVTDRIKETQTRASGLENQFMSVKKQLQKWVKTLEDERNQIDKFLNFKALRQSEDNVRSQVIRLKQNLKSVSALLSYPPGPATAEEHNAKVRSYFSRNSKKKNKKTEDQFYGFDSFAQDQSHSAFWSVLIDEEKKKVKEAVVQDRRHVDHLACYNAAENVVTKIGEVVEWAKNQFEEYESVIETLTDTEVQLPQIPFSSKGLMLHSSGEVDEDDAEFNHAGRNSGCFAQMLSIGTPLRLSP